MLILQIFLLKVLMAAANFFIEVDDSLVPTGKLAPVAGTLLDFTGQARAVEERVHQVRERES